MSRPNFQGLYRRARRERKLYRYRGLPCSIVPDDELWCVAGQDTQGGSGVLEWCRDELDAKNMLEQMLKYPQFRNLRAHKHQEENK